MEKFCINVNGANTILGISPQIAAATEHNSIYVLSPGYSTDKPVKMLCFDWYDNYWALSNIRSGSTPSAGFGVFFKNTEIAEFIGLLYKINKEDLKILYYPLYYMNDFKASNNLIKYSRSPFDYLIENVYNSKENEKYMNIYKFIDHNYDK